MTAAVSAKRRGKVAHVFSVVSVDPATAAGGATARVYLTAARPGITCTVGGNAATISAHLYGVHVVESDPYPYIDVTLPAHADGAVDVVVTDGTHGVATGDDAFTYSAGGGGGSIPADVVFRSNNISGTGTLSGAILDEDEPLPWDVLSGNGDLNAISPSTGLDFPCTNVFEVIGEYSGSPYGASAPHGQSVYTDQRRLTWESNHFAVPAVGESLFWRWYERTVISDLLDTTGARIHSVQTGYTTAPSIEWMWETPINQDGTWRPAFNVGGANASPNNRWSAPALPKNETHRVEFQYERTGTTTWKPHCKIYDSSDVLVRSDVDFKNSDGAGSTSFATITNLNSNNVTYLQSFQQGNNGCTWDIDAAQFPFTIKYFGATMIRRDDWCGPYIAAEETP